VVRKICRLALPDRGADAVDRHEPAAERLRAAA
jgi:hypothetical protein